MGGDAVAGGKMMATGTSMWAPPNTSATNTSGFSGLPGGYGAKNANAPNSGISFSGESGSSNWWSATESNLNILFIRWLLSNEVALITGKLPKNNMYSVRCIKD